MEYSAEKLKAQFGKFENKKTVLNFFLQDWLVLKNIFFKQYKELETKI